MRSKITLLALAVLLLTACQPSESISVFDKPVFPADSPVPAPPSPHPTSPPRSKPIVADEASPEDTFCAEIYQPVCGKIQVQCITAPCDPVWENFSNHCYAKKAGALEVKEGECI